MNRKAQFLALVDVLFESGLKSTTLLAEALGVSDESCRRALIILGKHKPRASIADTLAGLPVDVRNAVERFRKRDVEVPTESSAQAAQSA